MLPSPNLNDQSFEDIATRALRKTEIYATGWKGDNIHDPGVTMIELFSYLKMKQQEKINRVGEKSLRKFMKLIGMGFKWVRPAATYAAFDAECELSVFAGTKFEFHGVVFESEETIRVLNNKAFYKSEKYIFGDPPKVGAELLIGFNQPLPSNTLINIYVDVSETYGVTRNPVTAPDCFKPTSILQWEYYGQAGWLPLSIEMDETYNLLFAGIIRFQLDGKHSEMDGKWFIRCTLMRDLYEIAPIVNGIWLNAARLVQVNTQCRAFKFCRKQLEEDNMLADWFLCNAISRLYVKSGSLWKSAGTFGIKYALNKTDNGLRLSIESSSPLMPCAGQDVLMLVIYDEAFYSKFKGLRGTGFCGQTLKMPIGTCREGLGIMVSEKNGFRAYNLVEDLDSSNSDDRHFVYDEENRLISFGNNERGFAPPAGSEIVITGLRTTFGADGAIKANSLERPFGTETLPVRILRHKNATGGSNTETIEEMMARIPNELNRVRRAVSLADYEHIARHTQGLLLKNVAALPLYRPDGKMEEQAVTVVVEPFTDGRRIHAPEYLQNINLALERARLITTKVYTTFPILLGLEVYCEVAVVERGICDEKQIICKIKDYIDQLSLGSPISHAAVCVAVGSAPHVMYAKYLTMEIYGKKGKNSLGDIEIPRHARVYLKSVSVIEVLP